jgi:hypothetical protein
MFRNTAAALLALTIFSLPAMAAEKDTAAPANTTVTGIASTFDVSQLSTASESTAVGDRLTRPAIGRPDVLPALYVGLSALQAYDAYSTLSALKRGAREANPLMKGVVDHPAAFVALKAGMATLSIYSAERLWKEHQRKRAVVLMVVSNGIMSWVAYHNSHVLSSIR